MHDELSTKSLNLTMQESQGTNYNKSIESSLQLPHQLFENISHQNSWGTTLPEQINEKYHKVTLLASAFGGSFQVHEQNRTT